MSEKIELYERALATWGVQAQIMVAIEEMGELITALAKLGRKINGKTLHDIVEEVADVDIMIEQIKLILSQHGLLYYVEVAKREKLDRLEKLLNYFEKERKK